MDGTLVSSILFIKSLKLCFTLNIDVDYPPNKKNEVRWVALLCVEYPLTSFWSLEGLFCVDLFSQNAAYQKQELST